MSRTVIITFQIQYVQRRAQNKNEGLFKRPDVYRQHFNSHSVKLRDPPEMTESFQPSRSLGRPELLEKHWSSRTFSLFSSASFLGQSDPLPPTQPPTKDSVCWFSELQERERRPSEHHSRGGEPCSHPSWTLRGQTQGKRGWPWMKVRQTSRF